MGRGGGGGSERGEEGDREGGGWVNQFSGEDAGGDGVPETDGGGKGYGCRRQRADPPGSWMEPSLFYTVLARDGGVRYVYSLLSGLRVDRQADRQAGRQADRQADRQAGRHVDRHRQVDRQTCRQTQTGRQADM